MTETVLAVGAGKAEILFPEEMFPTEEGYNKIHDYPCARIICLESDGERFVFAHLELNNIFDSGTDRVVKTVREEWEVPCDHIWVHCLHVLETPHPQPDFKRDEMSLRFNSLFFSAVENAVRQAVKQAGENVRPAKAGARFGVCGSCNTNRNILTQDGWWLGSGEEEPKDTSVGVIRFDDMDDSPVAILYVYNSQASIMDGSTGEDGSRYVTADLAGKSAAFVEQEFPGCVAMYCTGAGGDGCPSFQSRRCVLGAGGKTWIKDLHEQGFLLVELLGERLGSEVVHCAEQIVCKIPDVPVMSRIGSVDFAGRPRVPREEMRPHKTFDFASDGSVRIMEPAFLQIGRDVVLVGVFAEIDALTEMQMKKNSPYPFTAVLTFSQFGHHAGKGMGKYMGNRSMYERVTFQAINSGVAEGSAEKLCDYVTDILCEMRACLNQ
ncbi:MAG: hypothetical protein ACI4OO_08575 [Otoolea sp.]